MQDARARAQRARRHWSKHHDFVDSSLTFRVKHQDRSPYNKKTEWIIFHTKCKWVTAHVLRAHVLLFTIRARCVYTSCSQTIFMYNVVVCSSWIYFIPKHMAFKRCRTSCRGRCTISAVLHQHFSNVSVRLLGGVCLFSFLKQPHQKDVLSKDSFLM